MTRNMLCPTLALVPAVCLLAFGAAANDLGKYGETFPIIETDLLAYFGAKLRAAAAGGKIDDLNRKFAATAQRHIQEPAAVDGLRPTDKPRSWLFDPSIIIPEDLHDAQGRVFAKAGDRINPLDRLPSYSRVLVFLDGRDPHQVRFGLDTSRRRGAERVMLILTGGTPVKLMKQQKTGFYYDQQGLLVAKFGITQVPAVVEREGNRLRISEVRP